MSLSTLWLAFGRALADSTLNPATRREVLAGLMALRALEHALVALGIRSGAAGNGDRDVALINARELLLAARGAVAQLDMPTRGRLAIEQLLCETEAALAVRPSVAPASLLDAITNYGDALLQTSVQLTMQVHWMAVAHVNEAYHGAAVLPWLLRAARLEAVVPDRSDGPYLLRYTRAAQRHRHDEHRLLAALYRGMHLLNRGNLPAAARMLTRVVDAAARRQLWHVEGRARHSLGCLRGRQQRYAEAVALFHRAVGIVEPDFRENVLMSLIEGLMDLGLLELARDACLFLTERGRTAWARDGGRITLLELAGRARDDAEVHRRFAELEPLDLTPETALWMRKEAATAFRSIGDLQRARQQAELRLQIAERFGYQQHVIEAEAFLCELDGESEAGKPRVAAARREAHSKSADAAALEQLQRDVQRWREQPGPLAEVVASVA